jgi:tetratricopeptide (TPR) repeat protein
MLSGYALVSLLLATVLALLVLGALAIVRHRPRSAAADLLGRGEFSAALVAAHTGDGATRADLYAAAVAAKHLLQLEHATELLRRILRAEPADGEARLELGLVAAYAGRLADAAELFRGVEASRADLLESLTLHRAWLALEQDDAGRARRLFEEVAVPVESKLRLSLGPVDPLLAEWSLQAAALWRAAGDRDRAAWAAAAGVAAAPASRLAERIGGAAPVG